MATSKYRSVQLLIFILLFGLYANWPLHTYTFDSLTYVLDVQSGQLQKMLHPHHLLYSPLSFVLWRAGQIFDSSLHPLPVMQLIGAFSLALAWLILFKLLLYWKIEFFVGLTASLLAVLTYGPWRFATITEPYALHILLVLLMFLLASQKRNNALVVTAVLATLNMQTAFLFLPSALILAFWESNERLRDVAKSLIAYAVTCLTMYLFFGYIAMGSLSALPAWFGKYAVDQRWWDPSLVKFITALFAASDGVFGLATPPSLWRTLSWISMSSLIVVAAYFLREWLKEQTQLTYAAALALFLQFAFYYQFDAGSPCYWTIVPALSALLLSGPLSIAASRRKGLTYALMAFTLLIGVLTVFTHEIIPQSKSSAYVPYQLAKSVKPIVGKGTLWMLGGNVNERVFRVFTSLSIRSLHDILLRGKGTNVQNLSLLKTKIEADIEKGPVFVFGDLFKGSFSGIVGLDNALIPPKDIAQAFAGFNLKPVSIEGRVYIWQLVKRSD